MIIVIDGDEKADLSSLLEKVEAGDEVFITHAGKPVARLAPFAGPLPPRIPGQDAGTVWIADDFDAPLPDDILADFGV